MRETKLFFIGALFFIVSSSSFGALNAYLRLTGETLGEIRGSVTQTGREDSVMVIGTSHEIVSPRDAASGLPTGKRQHKPFTITKEVDKSTPLLYHSLVSNENITEWELQYWQPATTGMEFQFYTIKLYNAKVVGIRQEMLNNKYPENMQHKEREHISFCYSHIEWIFHEEGHPDIVSEDEWSYENGNLLITDLNNDGMVNIGDLAMLASEWLYGTD